MRYLFFISSGKFNGTLLLILDSVCMCLMRENYYVCKLFQEAKCFSFLSLHLCVSVYQLLNRAFVIYFSFSFCSEKKVIRKKKQHENTHDKNQSNSHRSKRVKCMIVKFTYGHKWVAPLATNHRWPDKSARICQPTHSPRRNGK